jgi:DNA-binding transcriptional MerR regulator
VKEVTQQEIVDATGLNVSSLRMWRLKGIIPEGRVGLNPKKGRGRSRIFPKWVLGKCETLARLRRMGFTLKQAVAMWDEEERKAKEEHAAKLKLVHRLKLEQLLKKEKIKLNGETLDAIEYCQKEIVASIIPFVPDVKTKWKILRQLKKDDLFNHAWMMFAGGYNSCLLWDGETLQIAPDFMVAQFLAGNFARGTPYVVATLYPVFESLLKQLESKMVVTPTTWPAPKIRQQQGRNVLEIELQIDKGMSFDLDIDSAVLVTE